MFQAVSQFLGRLNQRLEFMNAGGFFLIPDRRLTRFTQLIDTLLKNVFFGIAQVPLVLTDGVRSHNGQCFGNEPQTESVARLNRHEDRKNQRQNHGL